MKSEQSSDGFLLDDLKQVQEVFVTSALHDSISSIDTDFDTMDLVDDFERFCSAGTFVLNDWTPKDRVPPGQVTDLTVVAASFSERTIHLRWTSPGDDMYVGQGQFRTSDIPKHDTS